MYNLYIMPQAHCLARTQIYLTQYQQQRLTVASQRTAITKSELIRLAVDQFLEQQDAKKNSDGKSKQLADMAGMWADRKDMADPSAYVEALRKPRF